MRQNRYFGIMALKQLLVLRNNAVSAMLHWFPSSGYYPSGRCGVVHLITKVLFAWLEFPSGYKKWQLRGEIRYVMLGIGEKGLNVIEKGSPPSGYLEIFVRY